MSDKKYSVTDLVRGALYKALGAVEHRGETILITRHTKVIAKISPETEDSNDDPVVSDPTTVVAPKGKK